MKRFSKEVHKFQLYCIYTVYIYTVFILYLSKEIYLKNTADDNHK